MRTDEPTQARQASRLGAFRRFLGFVGPGFAERSGALIDRLGLDHARRLYAQSQRGVGIVREAIDALGRPDIHMGSGKLSVSRTDQGPGFADRTRTLADRLGAAGRSRTVRLFDSERCLDRLQALTCPEE